MDARSIQATRLLGANKINFVIPIYQRNYDWTDKECAQLLKDIEEAGKHKDSGAHFIGSIVYIEDGGLTPDNRELMIVDGQQRLVTLTIIYLVLYKLAKELKDERLAEDLYTTYLINQFGSEDKKLKLRPTENNRKALQYLYDDESDKPTKPNNLIKNFNFLKGRISEENYQRVMEGLSHLMLVQLSLDREENPQRVYETLNSTGLGLSEADLIRNYILMELSQKEQDDIYKNYWGPIEQLAKYKDKDKSRVSEYIRDYLTLKLKSIPKINNVYKTFKGEYRNTNTNEFKNELKEIKRLANHYNKLLNPEKEPKQTIRQHLKYINRLEATVTYPFLLQVYDDYVSKKLIDEHVFVEALKLVESFMIRRFVMGLPTNTHNTLFMSLYNSVNTDNLYSVQNAFLKLSGNQRFPKDSEVIEALETKDIYSSSRHAKHCLERLENFNNKETVQIEGNKHITIEHIFPQKPDKEWEEDLSKEDYEIMQETRLHAISNLTLVGSNENLGNRPFLKKRDLPDVGYKASRLRLNKFLAGLEEWNVKNLKQRFKEDIKNQFLEIWQYPDMKKSGK